MESLLAEFGTTSLILAFAVVVLAGFVKGAVGFALPMIMISGVGSLMDAEAAIAAIVLPALVTNTMQATRQGLGAATATLRTYWRLNLVMLLMIALCAQLVAVLPGWLLFLILGGMVTVFGTIQLSGWRPVIPDARAHRMEWIAGTVAGFFGGLSGVWGPPVLMYLLARGVPKVDLVRAQGISFLTGSIVLVIAHLRSGLLDGVTLPFSAAMVVPAVAGMLLGRVAQDRLDQERFRRLTLFVLVLAGLNLLRRGFLAM
ncbi:sulfite exporter TauE/SafE family protein [Algicella marina]|uniref:Probable membrane transporter protein n=1 Tax=Algicella marina TaxID=2683284 RepID=A0A6P1T5N4_9RHOB|nr:sulfite exporter TauE/SafE family protein [Algicella marina]QHQ37003.1 TSUP family transporter [Algicella marina]